MASPTFLGSLLGEALVIIVIAALIYIIFKLGKGLLKIILGIIINSVLGVILIFAVDYLFNMGIPLQVYTLVPTALFGLPSVGTMIILRLFGIPL